MSEADVKSDGYRPSAIGLMLDADMLKARADAMYEYAISAEATIGKVSHVELHKAVGVLRKSRAKLMAQAAALINAEAEQ